MPTDWAASPENNRAPGMTCLRACGELSGSDSDLAGSRADLDVVAAGQMGLGYAFAARFGR